MTNKTEIFVEETHAHGQPSYRIKTPSATWVYHLEGAGFCSLFDPSGNDWITYRPEGVKTGPFRGIPNAVFRGGDSPDCHFHPGHLGPRGSTTSLVLQNPHQVVLESESANGRWSCRWEIFPDCAVFEITKQPPDDPSYWFLYEGTPGGRFEGADHCLRADGVLNSLEDRWEAPMSDIPWVAFYNPNGAHSLLLLAEGDHHDLTCYWPLSSAMTVFGFGRELSSVRNLLTKPVRILTAMLPTTEVDEIKKSARSLARRMKFE